MGSVFRLSILTILCTSSISWALQQHISKPSREAYRKHLDETCQIERLTDNEYYWQWELHEFLTSLRIQLLPDTADGDLTEFVRSPLSRYLPTSPLERDPRRLKCQREKENANRTDTLSSQSESASLFQDYIIDLLHPIPIETTTAPAPKGQGTRERVKRVFGDPLWCMLMNPYERFDNYVPS